MPSILIAEEDSHMQVLENLYHLLGKDFPLTYYMNILREPEWYSAFPSMERATIIRNRHHPFTFYFWLLFHGRKYDYILISTGPESEHYSTIVSILFFDLCCIAFRRKMILAIRALQVWHSSNPGILVMLRRWGARRIGRVLLETESQRNLFKEDYNDGEARKVGVIYGRYPDLLDVASFKKDSARTSGRIRIGLSGSVDATRRDYDILIDVLRALSFEDREKIEFITLGYCSGGNNNEIVRRLSEYTHVDAVDGILSDSDFNRRGVSCDCLIATLRKDKYGTLKGSGTFGDAVWLKKKMIIPSFADEKGEFAKTAVYYTTIAELLLIFKTLQEILEDEVDLQFYEKFTTENVLNNLRRDLSLHASDTTPSYGVTP